MEGHYSGVMVFVFWRVKGMGVNKSSRCGLCLHDGNNSQYVYMGRLLCFVMQLWLDMLIIKSISISKRLLY